MVQCKGLQIPKAVSSNLTLTSKSGVVPIGRTAVSKSAGVGSTPSFPANFVGRLVTIIIRLEGAIRLHADIRGLLLRELGQLSAELTEV